MKQNFDVISGATIRSILQSNYLDIVTLVRDTYIVHGEGKTINPDSYFLTYPEKPDVRIIALPAHVGGEFNISGIKWISSFPENISHGISRASAVIILNNYETGYPIACLEGSVISASRTAASAVLAAQGLIKSKTVKRLGIVGCGLISRYVLNFLLNTGWKIPELHLFDLSDKYGHSMKQHAQEAGIEKVQVISNKEELISSCDLITFATTSAIPHVHDINLFSHNPIVLHLSLRDLSPKIILNSNNIVDDVEHCLKANTSLHLAEQETGNRDFVTGSIDKLVLEKIILDQHKPTIYSPFGMGILDISLAFYVYKKAHLSESFVCISDFFN
jgi:N-[(2S)-2-amino-2-carboxyethyl]-L-glutamate dehydrogenase